MNWDRIEGNWKQFSGKVKEKWGELTDDDLARVNGNREQLEGILQERYGYAKDKARQEIDSWTKGM
ncbi:MAG: CsbD family protein [Hyphomicrobium sp.]|nr:CsbD family protein [Hyphomicrobium sp.]